MLSVASPRRTGMAASWCPCTGLCCPRRRRRAGRRRGHAAGQQRGDGDHERPGRAAARAVLGMQAGAQALGVTVGPVAGGLLAAPPRWRSRPGYGDCDLAGSARRRPGHLYPGQQHGDHDGDPARAGGRRRRDGEHGPRTGDHSGGGGGDPGAAHGRAAGPCPRQARRSHGRAAICALAPAWARRRVGAGRNSRAVRAGGYDSGAMPR